MQRMARDHALVAVVAVIVFFTNLGGPRLWDRDEPRNAGCAREMLAAGDWVTPVFNAELRTHKPVLLYWFMMTAYAVMGVNEFSARFWSAALAVGTVLATYHMGRRLFNARVGVWAGVILATSLMFDIAARAATPDSVLIFFSTLALLVYVLATFAPKAEGEEHLPPRLRTEGAYFPNSWLAAVLMYALMGMAVLAKGPVGLVLPTAVIGMYLLIVTLPPREDAPWWLRLLRPFAPSHFLRTCWRMRPITALAASLAVALPWYVWVHVRTDGEWTRGFFLTHNLGRATTAMEGHDGSILYYPFAILVGFFPWSVFAAPILIDLTTRLRKEDPWRLGYLLAVCWVGVYVGLFSLARTKLPSYITPMYPGLALLAGCFAYHVARNAAEVARRWQQLALAALGIVGAAFLIGLPIIASYFLPGEELLGLIGLVPLTVAVGCYALFERGKTLAGMRAFAMGAVCFTTLSMAFVTQRVDRRQQSEVLLRAIADHSNQPQVMAYGCLEPSWVFYGPGPIRQVGYKDLIERRQEVLGSGEDTFIITTTQHLDEVKDALPDDMQVIAEAPYFLRNRTLVVLGRTSPTTTAHAPRSTSSR